MATSPRKVCWKWDGDEKSFEKACKKLWTKRAREKFDKNARVRALRYDKLEAYYWGEAPRLQQRGSPQVHDHALEHHWHRDWQ